MIAKRKETAVPARPFHRLLASTLTALVLGSCQAPLAGTDPAGDLEPTHKALLETFLPTQGLPWDPAATWHVFQVQIGSWGVLSRSESHRRRLAELQTRWAAWSDKPAPTFRQATIDQRERFLFRLQTSDDPAARRLSRELRLLIVGALYASPLGTAVSGVTTPPKERPDWKTYQQQNTPPLPLSSLVYDPGTRSVGRANQPAETVDTLVVGSGPAGAMVAHERRRRGETVLVVDQGPFILPGALDTMAHSALLGNGGYWGNQDGSMLFNTAKAFGGGTAVNIDLALPPSLPSVQAQIAEWRAAGRIRPGQFTPAALDKTYAEVEQLVGTRQLDPGEINPNNDLLWKGTLAHGRQPSLYRLNAYKPGQSPLGGIKKRSAVSQLLLPAMQDSANPLTVMPDTKVTRLLVSGSGDTPQILGVEAVRQATPNLAGAWSDPSRLTMPFDQPVTIRAKRVILCAGTIGSAALMLQSGLTNPAIGRGIVGHPSMPIIGVFDKPIRNWEGTTASVYVDDYAKQDRFFLESMAAGPEYAALMMPGTARQILDFVGQYPNLGGFGVMLLDSVDMANRIALGPDGQPELHYTLGDADRKRLVHGLAEAVRILFKSGAKQVLVPSSEPVLTGQATDDPTYTFLSRLEDADRLEKHLQLIPGRNMVTSAHLQGSAKMGTSPADSVVDPDGKVWGTTNLYVIDSSIFPTTVGANPMQMIYTVAKQLAEALPKP
jgi:choline dehydrogenase-like flavoprotein